MDQNISEVKEEKKEKRPAGSFWKDAARDTWQTLSTGFLFVVILLGLLVYWAGLGTTVQGNVLGVGFQLVTVLFFALVGFCRRLKDIRWLNGTVYRLLHFLAGAVFLYLGYFVLWPAFSVALGEQKADSLASGAVNWAFVILAFVFYLIGYFGTLAVRALFRRAKARRLLKQAEYVEMIK